MQDMLNDKMRQAAVLVLIWTMSIKKKTRVDDKKMKYLKYTEDIKQ